MIFLDEVEVKFEDYPNGETGIFGLTVEPMFRGYHVVGFRYDSDADLIKLMFLKRHLDTMTRQPTRLYITYMPYSRMDRAPADKCFTLKYVADFINNLGFESVGIAEPHSDVTTALLDNALGESPAKDFVPLAMGSLHWSDAYDYLVFPDAGAEKRYAETFPGKKTLVGSKKRDFDTGKITGMAIHEKPFINGGSRALIVDDLCSRGGTFVGIGSILRDMGFAVVALFVTHLESSAHEGTILGDESPIDRIFTTDALDVSSFADHPNVTIYPLGGPV